MKRILAYALTMIMVLSLCTTTFASYGDPTGQQQQTTVQNTGYYDQSGRWINNSVQQQTTVQNTGYYDQSGRWISNSVQQQTTVQSTGYYDQYGNWVPSSTQNAGYYDQNGNWQQGYINNNQGYSNYSNPNGYYNGEVNTWNSYNTGGLEYQIPQWLQPVKQALNARILGDMDEPVSRGTVFFLNVDILQLSFDSMGVSRWSPDFVRPPFYDLNQLVPEAQTDVNIMYKKDIIKGVKVSEGVYAMLLSDNITAAEFATIMSRVAHKGRQLPIINTNISFIDVPTNHWAYDDIIFCASVGLFNGIGNNKFEPEREVTKAQAWKVFYEIARNNGARLENVAAASTRRLPVICKPPYNETNKGNYGNQTITSMSAFKRNVSLKIDEVITVKMAVNPSSIQYASFDWKNQDQSWDKVYEIVKSWYENGYAYCDIKGLKKGTQDLIVYSQDAYRKNATTTVNVTDDNYNNQGEITRLEAVTGDLVLFPGQEEDLIVKMYPYPKEVKEITWTSNNTNLIWIISKGTYGDLAKARIKAGNMEGSTTVTVRTTDGGTATLNIRVRVSNVYPTSTPYPTQTPYPTPTPTSYPSDTTRPRVVISAPDALLNPTTGEITLRDKVGNFITVTITATDNVSVNGFNITKNNVQGMNGLEWENTANDIVKLSPTSYSVRMKVTMLGALSFGVAPGAATDAAGNTSDYSNGCVVISD